MLGELIEKLTSPDVNLGPKPVRDPDGAVRHPGLDNHGMGTVFEELIRRFNEENNEEAGEHFTPRDAVTLMAKLLFLPVADRIESGTYLLYDGACGTGGMLTVAEDVLQRIARERGKQVSTHLFGQEINGETYAICKADLLLKGEGEAADNIVGGPEHSTLSNDAFSAREFDFMLSNPPYGKSWKTDLQRMGGKKDVRDPRFVIEHAGDPEYSLVTRSSDGQMLFLANKLSKMKRDTPLGSRIAEVHNGSSLFTGSAGQGESNIRRWIIENDWLEAIVALPLNMFYNTGIATYIWVLTNRKPEHRRGKVQLIDATQWFQPLRKNLGKKNCELGEDDIRRVCDAFLSFEESERSRIFDNEAFGHWKVTVERPLRLAVELSEERRDAFFETAVDAGESALAEAVDAVAERWGDGPHRDFGAFEAAVAVELGAGGRLKVRAKRRKMLRDGLADRDEAAEPVVRKVCPHGTAADPIRGLFEVGPGRRVVEYEPDTRCATPSRFRSRRRTGSRGSCAARCSHTPPTRGTLRAPSRWATRSASIGSSTSPRRCGRWRRSRPRSPRWSARRRGCSTEWYVGGRGRNEPRARGDRNGGWWWGDRRVGADRGVRAGLRVGRGGPAGAGASAAYEADEAAHLRGHVGDRRVRERAVREGLVAADRAGAVGRGDAGGVGRDGGRA